MPNLEPPPPKLSGRDLLESRFKSIKEGLDRWKDRYRQDANKACFLAMQALAADLSSELLSAVADTSSLGDLEPTALELFTKALMAVKASEKVDLVADCELVNIPLIEESVKEVHGE